MKQCVSLFCRKVKFEIRSMVWYVPQITIHPIVCYMKDVDRKHISQEFIFISDDLLHDASFVKYCIYETTEDLQERHRNSLIQFSDGCSSQYKSKIPFYDLSTAKMSMERNFFGSSHGKGPADGTSCVVKAAVTRALKGGKVLKNSTDVFECCKQNLQKDERKFYLVEKDAVKSNITLEYELRERLVAPQVMQHDIHSL